MTSGQQNSLLAAWPSHVLVPREIPSAHQRLQAHLKRQVLCSLPGRWPTEMMCQHRLETQTSQGGYLHMRWEDLGY